MRADNRPNKLAVFRQIDTWFFRESRPHGSFGANALSSIFPPPTRTLMGAIRTHIGNEYFTQHPKASWNDLDKLSELTTVIGNSDHLGDVRPAGVFLLRNDAPYQTNISAASTCYYPSALSVCVKTQQEDAGTDNSYYFALALSDDSYQTDIGTIRLPTLPKKVAGLSDLKGAKPLENAWLSKEAWESVLSGDVAALSTQAHSVKANEDFIDNEYRLGIQVNSEHRSVVEGQLYQTSHLRLDPAVSIVMPLTTNERSLSQVASADFLAQPSLLRLGGEGRMAHLQVMDSDDENLGLPKPPRQLLTQSGDGKSRFMIYLLSKLKMSAHSWLPQGFGSSEVGWQAEIRGIKINLVSACVGKAQREGGWDQKQHKPRAIESYLPAGSAFFVEVDADISDEALISTLHGQTMFADDEWGEGLMLLGRWLS